MADQGTLEITERSDLVTVAMAGEWDIATVANLIAALEQHSGAANLCIDLSEVAFIDSSTISTLLKTQHRREIAGQSTVILVLPDGSPVRRIVEVTGIAQSFIVQERR